MSHRGHGSFTPSQWICAGVGVFGALCTGGHREVKWAQPGSSSSHRWWGWGVQILKLKGKKSTVLAQPHHYSQLWLYFHGQSRVADAPHSLPGEMLPKEPTQGPKLGLAQAAPPNLRVPAACQGHSITAGTARAALAPQAPWKSAF